MKTSQGSTHSAMDSGTATLADRVGELHKRSAVAWVFFAAICFFLVLFHLHKNWIGLAQRELWLDEASTYLVSSYPIRRVLTLSIELHSQPPLYYVLLHYLALIRDTEVFLRAMSWTLCLALVAFVMLDLNELRILPRVVFSLLFIASDYTTYLAGELRPYALATLLTFVSSVLLVRLARDPKNRWRMLAYALTATAMLYSLTFDLWVIVAHGTYAGLVLLTSFRRVRFGEALRTYLPIVAIVVLVGVLYLPFLHLVTKYHGTEGHSDLWAGFHDTLKKQTYDEILDRFIPLSFPYSYALLALVAGAAFAERSPSVVLWLLLFFGQAGFVHAALYGRPVAIALRYMTPSFPIGLLGIAIGVHHLVQWKPRPAATVGLVFALWLLARKTSEAYELDLHKPMQLTNWRKLRKGLLGLPGSKAIFFETGFYSQMLGYLTRHDPNLTYLTRGFEEPAPGRPPAGGEPMTAAYVEAEIAKRATSTRCFLYSADRRDGKRADPVYEGTFLKAMDRIGYTERFHLETDSNVDMRHDWYDVHGYCRP